MDLKAAFDKLDRKELWKAMEEKGIRTGLVEKVKEIYVSTKNVVKVQWKVSGWLWTTKEVRQGCPVSGHNTLWERNQGSLSPIYLRKTKQYF